ncbi:MAG: response regulator [Gemmataceae bacterium]|nr:response regulator [Gemmataceae bacterium]
MGQVLTNLTLNARDAMPEGGKIVYQTTHVVPDADYLAHNVEARPGEYVCLRVADTGSGIPAELQQHIFEPFFTTKERGKGTGLGLAIVFGIVRQHGGWIACQSEPLRGTAFELFLPRCLAVSETSATDEPVAANALADGTILIVDDEPMIRQLANAILTQAGYHVLQAENGAVALDILRERPGQIDVIVLDAVMPKLSGEETLRELARSLSDDSVIFSSGYSTEQTGLHEFPQIRAFLPKPYRAEQLAQTVSEIFGQARQAARQS